MMTAIDKEVIERLAKEYCNGMSQQATIMQYHFRVETLSDLATALLAHVQDAELTKPQEATAWQYTFWDGERHSTNWHAKKLDHYYRDTKTNGYVKGIPLYTAPPNYEALAKENERLREALSLFLSNSSVQVNQPYECEKAEALAKDKP